MSSSEKEKSSNRSLLKNFENTVLADAWREKDEIEKEINAIREKELSQVESRALEESYRVIHEGISEITAALNKDVSVKTLAARKEVLLVREALKSRVFDAVKKNIIEFKASPAYEQYLLKAFESAAESVRDGTELNAVLSESDKGFEEKLKAKYGGKLHFKYDAGLLGGVIAYSKASGRYADFTLDARIEEEKKRYDERITLKID